MSTTIGIARFGESAKHERISFATEEEARKRLSLLEEPESMSFTMQGNNLAKAKGLTYIGLDVKQAKDFQDIAPDYSDAMKWFITLEAE